MTEREIYNKVRDRYKWQGTMTDASIIVKQEEEIEYYRGRIKLMEKALAESEEKFLQMFDSKNERISELKKALDEALEESSKKTVRPGDIVKFEGNYALVTFKTENCIANLSAKEENTVELCGTLIALERVRSE